MDHLWQISIDKKDAKLPQNLKIRLKKQLAKIHVKSKKVYRRRSTPLTIGDETGAWTKSKKSGRTKFEINRESALVKSLISTLENDQVKSFEYLLKYIEQMLPVTAIIASETETEEDLIQQEINNAEARSLALHFLEISYEQFDGSEEEFRKKMKKSAFFAEKSKFVNDLLNEFFKGL